MKDQAEQYGKKEAQQRLEAALRGARIVGHKPMEKSKPKPRSSRAQTTAKAVK